MLYAIVFEKNGPKILYRMLNKIKSSDAHKTPIKK